MPNEKFTELLSKTEGLTEEFKTAAAPIFEEAVNAAVQSKAEELKESYENTIASLTEKIASLETVKEECERSLMEQVETLNEHVESMVEEALAEKVSEVIDTLDGYTSEVVEEFSEKLHENIQDQTKVKLAEDFLCALKGLFEKYNIVAEGTDESLQEEINRLQSELSEVYESLSEELEHSKKLQEEVDGFKRKEIVEKYTKDMTESEADSFRRIVEGVEISVDDSFDQKMKVLSESFVSRRTDDEPKKSTLEVATLSVVSNAPVKVIEEHVEDKTNKATPASDVQYVLNLLH